MTLRSLRHGVRESEQQEKQSKAPSVAHGVQETPGTVNVGP